MSFRGSSQSLNINQQISTLTLNAGYDVLIEDNAVNLLNRVDLLISGGALIKKSLAVLGNLYVKGSFGSDLFLGNLYGVYATIDRLNPVFTDTITVTGNLQLGQNALLANTVSTARLVELQSGNGIQIVGALKGDVCFNDSVVTNVINPKDSSTDIVVNANINTSFRVNASSLCSPIIYADTIEEKTLGQGVSIPNINGNTAFNDTIITDFIKEKTPDAGVTIIGNLEMSNTNNWIIGNLACVGTVFANEIRAKDIGAGLTISNFNVSSVSSDFNPSIDCAYILGNVQLRWLTVNTKGLTVFEDATILGNLTVLGNTVKIQTETLIVSDNKIVLNGNAMVAGKDGGFCITRNQDENESGAGDVVNGTPFESGVLAAGSSTIVKLNPPVTRADNFYNEYWIRITSGPAIDEIRKIVSYNGTTNNATVNAFVATPTMGNTYELFSAKYVVLYWNELSDKWIFAASPHGNSDPSVIQTELTNLCVGNVESSGEVSGVTGTFENLTGNIIGSQATFNNIIATTSLTAQSFVGNVAGNVVGKNVVTQSLETNDITITNDFTVANVSGESFTADKFTGDLCGNVTGNLTGKNVVTINLTTQNFTIMNDLTVGNVVAETFTGDKFTGNLCGNVVGKNGTFENVSLISIITDFTATNIIATTLEADKFTGNVCGNVNGKNAIFESIETDNITIFNDFTVANVIGESFTADKFTGNLCGNVNGKFGVFEDVITNTVSTNDITITNDFTVTNVIGDSFTADKFTGNLCGNVNGKVGIFENVTTDTLETTTIVTTDITITNDFTVANVIGESFTADKFTGNLCGNVIGKTGTFVTVTTDNITVNDITIVNDFTVANVIGESFVADKFTGNLCGNVNGIKGVFEDVITNTVSTNDITITNDFTVTNVIGDSFTADKFTGNLCGNVNGKNGDFEDIVTTTLVTNTLVTNTLETTDITITNDFTVANVSGESFTANKFTGNLCGNVNGKNAIFENITTGILSVSQINTDFTAINVAGTTFTATDRFNGNVFGNIEGKNALFNVIVTNDLTTTDFTVINDSSLANVTAINVVADKFTGNVCGNVNGKVGIFENVSMNNVTTNFTALNIDATTLSADSFTGNVFGNVNGKTAVFETVTTTTLNVASNIDLQCKSLLNVASVFVENLHGKSELPINIYNTINIKNTSDGGNITFEGGIAIGGTDTIALDSTGLALGKSAYSGNATNAIAIGSSSSSIGDEGISIGYNSGATDVTATGGQNIAIGSNAMRTMTGSGSNLNIGIGSSSLFNFTSGIHIRNIAMGYQAMGGGSMKTSNTQYNICLGYQSGFVLNGAVNNIAIGTKTLRSATTGDQNIAIGEEALKAVVSSGYNIAIGKNSLLNSTQGSQVAIGVSALKTNVVGLRNVAVGTDSLKYNTGSDNTCLGFSTHTGYTTGFTSSGSTSVGSYALSVNRGGRNTAIGTNALRLNTIGTNNTALGYKAGYTNESGEQNICIGSNSDTINLSISNAVAIGYSAVAGNSSIAIGYGSLALSDDQVSIGSPTPTSATANATVWGQVFQNREWDDNANTIPYIDQQGNFVKNAPEGTILNIASKQINIDANVIISEDLEVQGILTINGNIFETPILKVFRVEKSVSQLIPDLTLTTISFDTPDINNSANPGGFWNGTDTFTINKEGWYNLAAAYDYGTDFPGAHLIQLYVNGNIAKTLGQGQLYTTGLSAQAQTTSLIYLNINDTIIVKTKQISGYNANIENAYLTVHKL
jgi:hypothetical protein